MAAVDASHCPTEQGSTREEDAGSLGGAGACQPEYDTPHTDTMTKGEVSVRPGDTRDGRAGSSDSANTVSPAECVGEPKTGTPAEPLEGRSPAQLAGVDMPCDDKPRGPESGYECRDDEAKDQQCDHKDNFTKPMVQPRKPADDGSVADGENVDQRKHCADEQRQETSVLNGLEVDVDGGERVGNGVDSMPGQADAKGKRNRSSLQCKDCGKRFNRRETLNLHRHFHAHNDPTPLTCKECGLTFQDRSSFIKHRKAHKEKQQKPAGPQPARPLPARPQLAGPQLAGPLPARPQLAGPLPTGPLPARPQLAGPLPAGPLPRGPLPAGPLPAGPLPAGPLPAGPQKDAVTSEGRRFTCAHCGKLFSTVVRLRDHNCSKSPDKPYHCPLCRREFQFKVAIPKHMQIHSLENIFQCQECNTHFSDGPAFRAHQRCHAALKPYECPECGMAFKHYSVMEDHRRRHTGNLPSHQCYICGKAFKYSSLLHQHQFLHTGHKPFCCPQCGKKFAFAQNMKAHYRQHRLSTATPLVAPDKQDPVPSHEPAHALGKENTGQSVKPRRLYNCPLCPLKFTIPANLRTHMLIHEAEYEKLDNLPTKEIKPLISEKGYNCPQCPSIFHNKLSYYGHLLKAHRSDSHYLEQVSAEHVQLRRRLESHSKSHKCPHCSKTFHQRSVLEAHMRVHSKDKPYQCNVCGKSFRCNSYLRQHLIIHTGEKPHKCPDCGKQFAFLQNMKTHLKLHQAKPFRCVNCRNFYTDEAQLKQHMLSHKGHKRHKCSLCDKSFSLACLLRDHINTHKGARPHRCSVCHKSFSWLSSLTVHQKSHEARLASSPVRGSARVAPRQLRDMESGQNAFQTQAPLSAQTQTKANQAELGSSECGLPVQWKVDGGEVLPVSLAQMSNQPQVFAQLHHSPLKSLSNPSSLPSLETSNMTESSILISGSLQTAVPKTVSPSIVGEVEKHRQSQPEMFRGVSTSTVAASNSSSSHHFPVSATYVEGAALWSVKPTPVTSQISLSKQESSPKKDDFNPHTAIPSTVGQSEKRVNGGELLKQRSPSLAVVSSSAQLDQSKAVLSPTPASLEVCSTLWDLQTPIGIPKTSSPSDKTGVNSDLQPGRTNQTSPQKGPTSLPYQPQHFARGVGPAVCGFQTNHVGPQALLPGHVKPGNAQELQQQPMAVMRPHMGRTLPQLSPRTGPRNLGGRMPFAPEGLLQCTICGHSVPREIDLERHYLEHAQGEI